jgi:hypothetical protein
MIGCGDRVDEDENWGWSLKFEWILCGLEWCRRIKKVGLQWKGKDLISVKRDGCDVGFFLGQSFVEFE